MTNQAQNLQEAIIAFFMLLIESILERRKANLREKRKSRSRMEGIFSDGRDAARSRPPVVIIIKKDYRSTQLF